MSDASVGVRMTCGETFDSDVSEAEVKGHQMSCGCAVEEDGLAADDSGTGDTEDTNDMTDDEPEENGSTGPSEDSAVADGLSVSWIGGGTYVVYSAYDDEDSHCYTVDLKGGEWGPTCTCKHGEVHGNDTKSCKHVQAAVKAHHDGPNLEHSIMLEWAGIIRDAEDTLQRAEAAVEASGANEPASSSNASDTDSGVSNDDGSVVNEDYSGSDALQGIATSLEEWFEEAASFNDFDADIVECKPATADGEPGIIVDRQPFSGGYYDDGWEDKDGFEEQKDAVKDAILSSRDEFQWFGEPDYSWFISEDDAMEVVE